LGSGEFAPGAACSSGTSLYSLARACLMASLAQEYRGLSAADGGLHEDGQPASLRRFPAPTERWARRLRALGGAAMGLLAVAAIGGAAWHPTSGGAPRTVAVPGERGTAVRGVEGLELVRASGKAQLPGAPSRPLPHVVLDATADVQELCDSVKDRVPMLLRISGWRIGLAPYQAVSYCTDGLGYTVKVEVEAGQDLAGHPEPAYLQLSIRNDTGPALFTAIMVEPIDGLCASLPVLPPKASPEGLPQAVLPVVAEEASAEEGTNSSAGRGGQAVPPTAGEEETSPQGANSSSANSSGKAGEEDELSKQVVALPSVNRSAETSARGADSPSTNSSDKTGGEDELPRPAVNLSSASSSAGRGDKAAPLVKETEARAKRGASPPLTNSSAEKGDGAPQLVMAEEVSAAPGTRSSDKEGDAAAPAKKAREATPGTSSPDMEGDAAAPAKKTREHTSADGDASSSAKSSDGAAGR